MNGYTSSNSSSSESFIEDFSWARDRKYKIKEKKTYLENPLNEMKEIVYDKDFDTSHFSDEGNYYKIMVSKILKLISAIKYLIVYFLFYMTL